jgi:hypothetical protein
METQQTNNFEGWAVVELFGHQREVGFVTTQIFGSAVLFRIDTPELPEREYTLQRPAYANLHPPTEHASTTKWCPAGSKVKRQAVPARTKLVGPSAIYAMTPCTEATAMIAIERSIEPPLILLELAEEKQLQLATNGPHEEDEPVDRVCEECGQTPEDGHSESCSFADADDDPI